MPGIMWKGSTPFSWSLAVNPMSMNMRESARVKVRPMNPRMRESRFIRWNDFIAVGVAVVGILLAGDGVGDDLIYFCFGLGADGGYG